MRVHKVAFACRTSLVIDAVQSGVGCNISVFPGLRSEEAMLVAVVSLLVQSARCMHAVVNMSTYCSQFLCRSGTFRMKCYKSTFHISHPREFFRAVYLTWPTSLRSLPLWCAWNGNQV